LTITVPASSTQAVDQVAFTLTGISQYIAAAGGLGTAAFGLVDSSKAIMGGVSNSGFRFITKAITPLLSEAGAHRGQAFGPADIIRTLRANWLNGVAKADQKATAKSLIRMGITPANAAGLAARTGISPKALTDIATKISAHEALTVEEVGVLGRFDAVVSAVLDEAYERGDQQYRNTSKLISAVVAIVLALVGGAIVYVNGHPTQPLSDYFQARDFVTALLVGAISTPLAPIAKDVSSSLAGAVKALSGG
jgi:hypothetical protein